MFKALTPTLSEGDLSLYLKLQDDGTVRVTVIPQKEADGKTPAKPFSVEGTPEELDEQFPAAVANYQSTRESIAEQMERITADMQKNADAKAEESKNKGSKTASKGSTSSASKSAKAPKPQSASASKKSSAKASTPAPKKTTQPPSGGNESKSVPSATFGGGYTVQFFSQFAADDLRKLAEQVLPGRERRGIAKMKPDTLASKIVMHLADLESRNELTPEIAVTVSNWHSKMRAQV